MDLSLIAAMKRIRAIITVVLCLLLRAGGEQILDRVNVNPIVCVRVVLAMDVGRPSNVVALRSVWQCVVD